MFLRFEMSQHMMDIGLVKTPSAILWMLWGSSLLSGLISTLYFRECWGFAGTVFLYGLLSMACFYTGYEMLDVQLDRHAPLAAQSARVIGKVIKNTNGRTTHGILELDTMCQAALPAVYAGTWTLYTALKYGDMICFYTRPGALSAPWRKVAACPPLTPHLFPLVRDSTRKSSLLLFFKKEVLA